MGLDALFSPRAVAVVGASNRELTIGYRIIENLLGFGFGGPIYPINPKGGEIRGLKAYPSILDAPGPVDVAHIVIKNIHVPACVQDCAKKGVKAVIVNTAGFREIGEQGAALEAQLVDLAKRTGIRVFGPNCQGIINTDPAVRAYCNFTFTRPSPGHISIVARWEKQVLRAFSLVCARWPDVLNRPLPSVDERPEKADFLCRRRHVNHQRPIRGAQSSDGIRRDIVRGKETMA